MYLPIYIFQYMIVIYIVWRVKMFPKYEQIKSIIISVKEVREYIVSGSADNEVILSIREDVRFAMKEVNRSLFRVDNIKECNVDDVCDNLDQMESMSKIDKWCLFVEKIVVELEEQPNQVYAEFQNIINATRYVDRDIIIESVKKRLMSQPMDIIKGYNQYYQSFSSFWGTLDVENDVWEVVENRVDQLIEHLDDFIWLFNRLGDNRSRLVLNKYLQYWLSYDMKCIVEMYENNFGDYFDFDLIPSDEESVFVDLGAFNGDSITQFINAYRKYKKIYGFEITPSTFEELKNNLEEFDNIELINKGAGDAKSIQYMIGDGTTSKIIGEQIEGSYPIEISTVDDEISEPITIIKMDIEGAEKSALLGCRRHIEEDRPKLLICVYHNNVDMWKIPQMIQDIRDDYTFYLRSNGRQHGPSEIVLFAL